MLYANTTDCIICYEEYDTETRRPCIGKCGHSICENCKYQLVTLRCPQCYRKEAFAVTTISYEILEIVKNSKRLKTEESSNLVNPIDNAEDINKGTCCECKRRYGGKLRVCVTCAEKADVLLYDDIKKEFFLNAENNDVDAALRRAKKIAICGDCERDGVQHEGHRTMPLALLKSNLENRVTTTAEEKINAMSKYPEEIRHKYLEELREKLKYELEITTNLMEVYFKMCNMLPASKRKIHFNIIEKRLEKINGDIRLIDDLKTSIINTAYTSVTQRSLEVSEKEDVLVDSINSEDACFLKQNLYDYHWLPPDRRSQLTLIRIGCEATKRSIGLECFSAKTTIEYEQYGKSTFIKCEELKENTIVNDNFVNVLCKDMSALITNQVDILDFLSVFDYGGHRKKLFSDDSSIEFFKSLEHSLKSRAQKFRVKSIYLDPFDMNQAVRVITSMEPVSVLFITLNFKLSDQEIDIDEILKLIIQHTSTFQKIVIQYCEIADVDIDAVFSPSKLIKKFESSFEFLLEDDTEENYLQKMMGNLSLQSITALKVLGNPMIMKVIIKDFELFTVQNLRKVSNHIRDCLDYLKPDPKVDVYSIEMSDFKHTVEASIKTKHEGSRVFWYENRKKGDFRKRVVHDFDINLRNQKCVLKELRFEIINDELLGMLIEVLKCRTIPIQVEKLVLETGQPNYILEISSNLDPTSLKSVEIINRSENELELQVNRWNNVEELIIKGCIVTTSIQDLNLISCSKVDIRVQDMSLGDVIYIKENLTKSPSLQKLKIGSLTSAIDESIYLLVGQPYRRIPGIRSIWFFRMAISEQLLHIIYHEQQKFILISLVDRGLVPEDAVN